MQQRIPFVFVLRDFPRNSRLACRFHTVAVGSIDENALQIVGENAVIEMPFPVDQILRGTTESLLVVADWVFNNSRMMRASDISFRFRFV